MTIYWLETDGNRWLVISETYDIASYEQFCREMDELHEFWTTNKELANEEAAELN